MASDLFRQRSSALQDSLREAYTGGEAGVDKCKAAIAALHEELSDTDGNAGFTKHEVTQMAFRALNLELLAEARAAAVGSGERDYGRIAQLLDVSIACVSEEAPPATWGVQSNVPFLLLGDLLQCEPISCCAVIWGLLESRRRVLTRPIFIPQEGRTTGSRSALALLKLCNELLRKLSKATHGEFRGRVLHFLAYVFPIHERSAVNVSGKANTAIATHFSTEDEFAADEAEAAPAAQSQAPADAVAAPQDDSDSDSKTVVDFKLYKTLWGLQRMLLNPRSTVMSPDMWSEAIGAIELVLAAFEGSAFSEADLGRGLGVSASASNAVGSGGEGEGAGRGHKGEIAAHFFEPKYLTASRLLRLQLRDPIFRKNVLTQMLILFRVANVTAAAASVPTNGSAGANAALPASASVGGHLRSSDETLSGLQSRAVALLRKTPPDGPVFEALLQHVLLRDERWCRWKQQKCQPFNRTGTDNGASLASGATVTDGAKKRKRLPMMSLGALGSGSSKRTKRGGGQHHADLQKLFAGGDNPDNETCLSSAESDYIPQLHPFLEPFEDAMDPENAIEEEYHPKHDKVYMWRMGRLLTRNHIANMVKVLSDGAESGIKELQDQRSASDKKE